MRKDIIFYLKKIHKDKNVYLLAALNMFLILAFYFLVRNLDRPTEFIEGIRFVLDHLGVYIVAFLVGLSSWLLWSLLLLSLFIRLPGVRDFVDNYIDEYVDDYYHRYNWNESDSSSDSFAMILHAICVITILVFNIIFINSFAVIMFYVVVILIIVIMIIHRFIVNYRNVL